MISKNFYIVGTLVLLVGLNSACSMAGKRHVDKAAKRMEKRSPNQQQFFNAERAAIDHKDIEERNGSLWSNTYNSRLFDNMYRASKVGDTVMIVVDESATGTNKGDTKTNKKTEHDTSVDNLGGLMAKLQGMLSGLNPANLFKAKTESKFKGDGSTKREGSLSAKITATVTKVLRNGNLVIKGERHMKINNEEQVLVVEGIISPYDILPDNRVLSSSLANARISYTGFGIVADRQKPGWLVRVLDHIWPF